MRRKSKKVKEEAKVESSSERRSKRSSTRRKKTYEDEEGGSGVEEGRTTEEESSITKTRDRGNRRYATRGRRQKVEESEEEEGSQNEERADCDEESSNTIPVVTEAGDGDDQAADSDDSKGIKSTSSVVNTAIAVNDEPSTCTSDSQFWGMKTGTVVQEDKPDALPMETPAQGEEDDGEEEVSRSHSRKKKLKLSRECLHENREAIPKIRLRLSRNRSGGYETEKLEAERIEAKAAGVEPVVEVFKVEGVTDKPEETAEQSSEPLEVIEPEAVKPDSTEVEGTAEVVELDKEVEDTKAEVVEVEKEVDDTNAEVVELDREVEDTKTEVVEADKEVEDPKTEVVEADKEVEDTKTEVVEADKEVEDTKAEVVEADKEVEVTKAEVVDEVAVGVTPEETTVDEEKMEVPPEVEEVTVSPVVEHEEKEEESVPEPVIEEENPTEVVQPIENKDVEKLAVEMVAETPIASGEAQVEEGNKVNAMIEESTVVEEMKDSSASSEKEDVVADEEKTEHEEQIESGAPRDTEEEKKELDEEENQVSTTCETEVDVKVKDGSEEVSEANSELPVDKSEKGVAEEKEVVTVDQSKVVNEDESVVVNEGSVSKGAENIVPKDREEGDNESCDEKQLKGEEEVTGEEGTELHSVEEGPHQKLTSGDRVSKIDRSTLRHEDDDQTQKRRGRRRRSQSFGEEGGSGNSEGQRQPVVVVPHEPQPQPKRVTLKRPKLNRAVSSTSLKDNETEEKEEQVDAPIKIEEEEKKEDGEKVQETPVDNEEENKEEISPDEPKSSAEDEGLKRRRRKWGRNKSEVGPSQSKRAFMSISTQSLKGLIPEVKPLPIHELRLSIEKDDVQDICVDEEESCEALADETIVRMIDANGQNERTIWAQVIDDEMRPTIHPEAPRVPVLGGADVNMSGGPVRRISIVSDDATRLQRSPSPPRHPPSNVLFLSNLVRPFTVQQLKELLARTGTVVEDGFWIDRIKSMCLVQYETEEQARETRHALHGVRWPISNPKRLWVDFSTKERLEESKKEGSAPPLPQTTGPSLTPPHPTSRDDFPRKTEPLRVDGSGMAAMHPSHRGAPGSPGRQGHGMAFQPGLIIPGVQTGEGVSSENVAWQQRGRPRPEPPPLRPGANARDFKMSVPVREWDLDKVVQQSPPRQGLHGPLHPSAMDERRRPDVAGQPGGHRDRVIPSPPPSLQEMQARKTKRKDVEAASAEAPANLLDSLFRKTKATPSIYWLPLTADQIKVKEEIRRQHLAEHERRMAEMKRAAAKERAGRRRRHSSSPRRRSRRRSGEDSGPTRKRPSESMKGRKAGSISPKK